ncbi:hypothetical protein K466DRAFT_215510 [Polyporus arcularius HHB13444]|uniref:Uncharacterized protein n=1 Tax=Polyporus arcularius HHB13444 TaxID=1314778 RepID=A0A5C3P6Y1_9APHY|nr:hypothetical protein K466DRAFT_215510 [Polyporus arcularius HHB13444]
MKTPLGQSGISFLHVISISAVTQARLPARSACPRRNIASPVALPRFRFLTRSSGESPRLSYIPQNDTQHIDLSSSTLVPLSPNVAASSPALPHPLPFPSRTPPSVLRLESSQWQTTEPRARVRLQPARGQHDGLLRARASRTRSSTTEGRETRHKEGELAAGGGIAGYLAQESVSVRIAYPARAENTQPRQMSVSYTRLHPRPSLTPLLCPRIPHRRGAGKRLRRWSPLTTRAAARVEEVAN